MAGPDGAGAHLVNDAHRQQSSGLRMDWGPAGAAAVAQDTDVVVVVDVLSFTTTVTVAVERGIEVFPCRWNDARAASYAAEEDAVLAVGRRVARRTGSGVSLSPSSVLAATGVERLVLPSPNGSTISLGLAEAGSSVVAASLRNATAVARWLAADARVAVVAAGERWPDGSLRPAAEDLWGAGAVLAALSDRGRTDLSPEARLAEQAFRAVADRLPVELRVCASGCELVDSGFEADVEVAADLDASDAVPVLVDGSFTWRAGS